MKAQAKIAAKDRVANGLCPQCGKEAAPYRLCYDCRQAGRLNRALKRGQKLGVFQFMGNPNRLTKNTLIWFGPKRNDPDANHEMNKWATPWHMPDSDGRTKPRLRGMRVDVEATLEKVIEFIGRPATIEEIVSAWGKLRDKRSSPLPNDIGRIIVAADKRARKAERRAAAFAKSEAGRAPAVNLHDRAGGEK